MGKYVKNDFLARESAFKRKRVKKFRSRQMLFYGYMLKLEKWYFLTSFVYLLSSIFYLLSSIFP